MIESINISNFKAFNNMQKVKCKPITLIYGQNSAGKSSVLQSLLLLQQTMNEINIDDTALITKGKLLDLGNYREMVHSHNTDNNIVLSSSFKIKKEFRFGLWRSLVDSVKYESIFSCDKSNLISLEKINLYYNGDKKPFITLKKSNSNDTYRMWTTTRSIRGAKPNNYIIENICKESSIIESIYEKLKTKHIKYSSMDKIYEILKNTAKYIVISVEGFLISGVGIKKDYNINNHLKDIKGLDLDDLLILTGINYKNELSSITYLGPLREYPERHYIFSGSSPISVGKSGKNMSDMLFRNQSLIKEVNDWLNKFEINYNMKINKINDSEITDVYSMRLIDTVSNISVSPLDVGFGISQILPIIVQSLISKNSCICIEQPEIHIHPKLQTIFGSFLAECIKQDNQFIIETHSEHILLRLKRLIREGKLTNDDVCVIYVQRAKNGSKCLELRLDEDGDFIDEWPDGFFEDGYKEVFF
ncbi:DUF3696 domain-containing protein [Clostridium perfringens]|uniref:DUF3696 domain-containing protein n=1 Tax=Clostridium perfringens TaxID=1502 RepID=UPI00224565ED|nr:DUF3696 domain-containing protein [Clostridium perfringens]MCX0414540.1 DUF3696 domain-containing protein [Clostridium perfringens]